MKPDTAQQAYEMRFNTVMIQVSTLLTLLDDAQAKAEKDPKNWGYVGSLSHVSEILHQAIDFLSGEETPFK